MLRLLNMLIAKYLTWIMDASILIFSTITFVEAVDIGVKIISGTAALLAVWYTVPRLKVEIEGKKLENESKRLDNELKKREIARLDREEAKQIAEHKKRIARK